MAVLGIDTSNYATSLAVLDAAGEVVYAAKRFLPVKQGELGLRQSDAVFHHTTALPVLLEELQNKGTLKDIQAVGVSVKPRPAEGSYMPCFLAGQAFAAAFAAGAGARLVPTSHQEGHVAAAQLAAGLLNVPQSIVFHISGGTTEMLLCEATTPMKILGKSLDLYAGQAVDRLGVRLGFSFPAGAEVSSLAATCSDEIQSPKVSVRGCDCHLSGLQNQCEALLAQGRQAAYVAKYCLAAIADTVLAMLAAAQKQHPGLPVLCAGGVMSSDLVRKRVKKTMPAVHFVPAQYASDNAIGTCVIAAREVGLWPM